MPLSTILSTVLNTVDSAVDAAANLVVEKNPSYDSDITMLVGVIDSLNAKFNPTAVPAAQAIAAAATSLTTAATTAPAAVSAITSKTSTATQKASAAGILVQDAESVFNAIKALF